MRLEGQLSQQPVLRHDEHNLDYHEHNFDVDDAYVHTEWQQHPLHRGHSVL